MKNMKVLGARVKLGKMFLGTSDKLSEDSKTRLIQACQDKGPDELTKERDELEKRAKSSEDQSEEDLCIACINIIDKDLSERDSLMSAQSPKEEPDAEQQELQRTNEALLPRDQTLDELDDSDESGVVPGTVGNGSNSRKESKAIAEGATNAAGTNTGEGAQSTSGCNTPEPQLGVMTPKAMADVLAMEEQVKQAKAKSEVKGNEDSTGSHIRISCSGCGEGKKWDPDSWRCQDLLKLVTEKPASRSIYGNNLRQPISMRDMVIGPEHAYLDAAGMAITVHVGTTGVMAGEAELAATAAGATEAARLYSTKAEEVLSKATTVGLVAGVVGFGAGLIDLVVCARRWKSTGERIKELGNLLDTHFKKDSRVPISQAQLKKQVVNYAIDKKKSKRSRTKIAAAGNFSGLVGGGVGFGVALATNPVGWGIAVAISSAAIIVGVSLLAKRGLRLRGKTSKAKAYTKRLLKCFDQQGNDAWASTESQMAQQIIEKLVPGYSKNIGDPGTTERKEFKKLLKSRLIYCAKSERQTMASFIVRGFIEECKAPQQEDEAAVNDATNEDSNTAETDATTAGDEAMMAQVDAPNLPANSTIATSFFGSFINALNLDKKEERGKILRKILGEKKRWKDQLNNALEGDTPMIAERDLARQWVEEVMGKMSSW